MAILSLTIYACLSVCLLVTLQKRARTDFPEIYRISSALNKDHFGTFGVDFYTFIELGSVEVCPLGMRPVIIGIVIIFGILVLVLILFLFDSYSHLYFCH